MRWVVDPIDGTVNYLYGYPAWSVSIAAEVLDPGSGPHASGEAVAGVVLVPAAGAAWTATLGGGAWRDGRRMHGSQARSLAQALVGTGFGYTAETRRRQAEVLTRVLPAVRDIRRSGSAAYDLCCAAEGLLDAYYERGLNPWDSGGRRAHRAGSRPAGRWARRQAGLPRPGHRRAARAVCGAGGPAECGPAGGSIVRGGTRRRAPAEPLPCRFPEAARWRRRAGR